MKKFLFRFTNGFCYSIAITAIIQLIITLTTNTMNMLPEYIERFDNILVAYMVQLLLIGVIGSRQEEPLSWNGSVRDWLYKVLFIWL